MYRSQRIPHPAARDITKWDECRLGLLNVRVVDDEFMRLVQRVLLGGQYVMDDGRTVQLNLPTTSET